MGCRKSESQLGHAVSLATAANVPAAPDGTRAQRRTVIVIVISSWSVQTIR